MPIYSESLIMTALTILLHGNERGYIVTQMTEKKTCWLSLWQGKHSKLHSKQDT